MPEPDIPESATADQRGAASRVKETLDQVREEGGGSPRQVNVRAIGARCDDVQTGAIALISVGLVAAVVGTAAASPSARLVYARDEAASACPDEGALRRAVAALVGYDAFFPWAKRTVIATVSMRERVFFARVELVDEQGIVHGGHELRADAACAELLDAVALAVAIAIDPQIALAPRPAAATPVEAPGSPPPPLEASPPPPPGADAPPAPAPPPPPPPAPGETPRTAPLPHERALRFQATAGAVAALGMTPEPSFGGAAGLEARVRLASLGVEGLILAPASRPAQGGGSFSAWPLAGVLVPCVHVGQVFGCVVGQAGAVFASGQGTSGARSLSLLWWAAGGRVGAAFPLTDRFFLRLHLDVVGDASPVRYVFNGIEQMTAPLVAGTFGVDGVVRFP